MKKQKKKRKFIYVVTTLLFGYKITPKGKRKGKRYYGVKNERVVAWYKKVRDAEACIMRNWGDIYEMGRYNYAVIEKTEEGLYPWIFKEYWYKWKGGIKKGKYIKSTKPKPYKQVVNFGIG